MQTRRLLLYSLIPVAATVLFLAAAPAAAGPSVEVSVPGSADWIDTHLDVMKGDLLRITATGSWTEGDKTNGPAGTGKPWADNFFNFADLGACNYCAQTATPFWGALIGYIGSSPPRAGSYTSKTVLKKASKIFYIGDRYDAAAPASGTLWLNKNTDAYSNYTIDNGGQVDAKISVMPPESRAKYYERAVAAAASLDALTPLQQATDFCVRASLDHWRNKAVKHMLKSQLCGPQAASPVHSKFCAAGVDLALFVGTVHDDVIKISAGASEGKMMNATWDTGRLIYEMISLYPNNEAKLFGLIGVPALDCTMAYFWYTGELGGQLGRLIRERFLLPEAGTGDQRSGGQDPVKPSKEESGDKTSGGGTDVPDPPSDVSLALVSDGWGILVSWNDNSNNESGFDIFNGARHAKVAANQTSLSSDWGLSYDESGLLHGQTMCFQVSAYNAAGTSAPTPEDCITVP